MIGFIDPGSGAIGFIHGLRLEGDNRFWGWVCYDQYTCAACEGNEGEGCDVCNEWQRNVYLDLNPLLTCIAVAGALDLAWTAGSMGLPKPAVALAMRNTDGKAAP